MPVEKCRRNCSATGNTTSKSDFQRSKCAACKSADDGKTPEAIIMKPKISVNDVGQKLEAASTSSVQQNVCDCRKYPGSFL